MDHISATFYFNAPETVLAREEKPRFGSLIIRPEVLKSSCPALVATGKEHKSARHFTDDILKLRVSHLAPSFDKVSERLLKKWQDSSSFVLFDFLLEWVSNTSCNWLFGMDAELEKIKLWVYNSVSIDTDTLLTQALGKLINLAVK